MAEAAAAKNAVLIPLSWRWVAAFGQRGTARLAVAAIIVAGIFGLSAAWFAGGVAAPLITNGLSRLPEGASIQHQTLNWPEHAEPVILDTPKVTVEFVPQGAPIEGRLSHFHVQFRRRDVLFSSIFGHLAIPHPQGWIIELSRSETLPIWEAWRPFVVIGAGVSAFLLALVTWTGVALAGVVPVRLGLFFVDREVTLAGCARVVVASLFGGVLLLSASIVGYGLDRLSLYGLLIAFPVHLAVDGVMLLGACWNLPVTDRRLAARQSAGAKEPARRNPFDDAGTSGDREDGNVFRGGGTGGGT